MVVVLVPPPMRLDILLYYLLPQCSRSAPPRTCRSEVALLLPVVVVLVPPPMRLDMDPALVGPPNMEDVRWCGTAGAVLPCR